MMLFSRSSCIVLVVVLGCTPGRRWAQGSRAIVAIPAVKKGLSNQRMRVIQDMVSAATLGLPVRLPKALTSRRGCHYESSCYLKYQTSADFWQVFDREETLKALAAVGVEVLEGEDDTLGQQVVSPLAWPMTHSNLISQTDAVRKWLDDEVSKRRRRNATNNAVSIALANPAYCCLLLLPDTTTAVMQIARVNDALVTAKRTRRYANMVLAAYQSRLQPTASGGPPRTCAVHWRDDDDFVVSNHKLDRKTYTTEMARAIASLQDCGGALLVLGDVPTRRLRHLLASLAEAYCAATGREPTLPADASNESHAHQTCAGFQTRRLHTKQSLIRSINWTREYDGWDDLVGMIDFELGTRVNTFVGSPFSSFSVLIAVARGDTRTRPARTVVASRTQLTIMPQTIDVDDSLAQLFRIQFPYSWNIVRPDPCDVRKVVSRKYFPRFPTDLMSQAFRSMSDKYAKRLEAHPSCVFDNRGLTRSVYLLRFACFVILATFLSYCHKVVRTRRARLDLSCYG